MTEQIANSLTDPTATLTAGIAAGDTSLAVSGWASPLPAVGTFRIRIGSEIILVGSVSGSTLGGLTRGAESTTAASHASGADVDLVLTAGGLAAYVSENGGSQPTEHAVYSCTGTVTAGGVLDLTWAKESGDDFLDLTDPTEPVVPAAGVYAASATAVLGAAPLAGPTDKALAYIFLDAEGLGVSASGYLDADEDLTVVRVSFGITYFIPEAGTLVTQGVATASSVDLTFEVRVEVQRLA